MPFPRFRMEEGTPAFEHFEREALKVSSSRAAYEVVQRMVKRILDAPLDGQPVVGIDGTFAKTSGEFRTSDARVPALLFVWHVDQIERVIRMIHVCPEAEARGQERTLTDAHLRRIVEQAIEDARLRAHSH